MGQMWKQIRFFEAFYTRRKFVDKFIVYMTFAAVVKAFKLIILSKFTQRGKFVQSLRFEQCLLGEANVIKLVVLNKFAHEQLLSNV